MARRSFAKLTSKGQITIPKDVREALCLKTGDRVVFDIENGRARVERARSFLDLQGVLKDRRPSANWQAIRDEAREYVAAKASAEIHDVNAAE